MGLLGLFFVSPSLGQRTVLKILEAEKGQADALGAVVDDPQAPISSSKGGDSSDPASQTSSEASGEKYVEMHRIDDINDEDGDSQDGRKPRSRSASNGRASSAGGAAARGINNRGGSAENLGSEMVSPGDSPRVARHPRSRGTSPAPPPPSPATPCKTPGFSTSTDGSPCDRDRLDECNLTSLR